MTNWTAADLPSFAGRTVIITGANSGLGAVTARELARNGAKVILAVRNTGKGESAAQQMTGPKTGHVEVRRLDLQDLSSVRQFADGVDKVDVLINNAGIMAAPYALTVDGFESQIGTNHLGHFALTNLLLPKLTDRVVTVSSMAHWPGRINLDDLNWKIPPVLAVAGLQPVEARQPAFHQRAAATPRFGRFTAARPGGPPRLLAHQPARGLGPQVGRRADVSRHPGGGHRRRLRRPANPVRGVAGPAGQHVRRPQVRLTSAEPNRLAAAGGPKTRPWPPRSGSCPSSSRTPNFRSEVHMR